MRNHGLRAQSLRNSADIAGQGRRTVTLSRQAHSYSGQRRATVILRAVKEQETVDRLAALATPRLANLLRLRSVKHIYDPTPGALNSAVVEDGHKVILDKFKRASQPYRGIERFLSDEKVMEYIIGPGLLPVVMAVSKDIMGKKLLVTRRLAARDDDKGVAGHFDGFGVRIMMYFDRGAEETILEWSCLYGVL